ncbi:hypothetical protein P154DRAFT_533382 [Amniculicola lignicola CBS 123094]|uniref:Uncharacterized protein n=1 Tax=Amniculicola lignicola CBS 123094 TaxID=1392246 RepID=A0A6A5WST9_9PLEO|nr:hypothetical protein P154DRAFT_533382 [Amniculicola lignicola CBS 123094]
MGAKLSYQPWSQAESELFLIRIFKEHIYKPLQGRTTNEHEHHLKNLLIFCLPKIRKAVHAYHKNNPQNTFCQRGTESVLYNPVNNRDENHYYGVLSEIFKLDGKPLEEGIYEVVDADYRLQIHCHAGSAEEMQENDMMLHWLLY